jgi:hypothetical protein
MRKGIKPRVKEYIIARMDDPANFHTETSFCMELALTAFIEKYHPKIFDRGIRGIKIDLAANRKNYIAAIVTRYSVDYFIVRF